jgi:hypothetical protein
MRQHVIAGHRQFECPDEWFEYLSPYFEGARYARRTGRFTVTAHFKQLPRYSCTTSAYADPDWRQVSMAFLPTE